MLSKRIGSDILIHPVPLAPPAEDPKLNGDFLVSLAHKNGRAKSKKGSVLFAEGQKASGVFIVWEGRVKLSLSSASGKSLTLGFFGPGTVLGLAAAIVGQNYESTAEVVEPTISSFLPRKELLANLRGNPLAALRAAENLSETCISILAGMKTISLSETADQKLAQFLLALCDQSKSSSREMPLNLHVSHDDIAHMIGISRETVTRVFSRLKDKKILRGPKRSTLMIQDKAALEQLAEFSESKRSRFFRQAAQ
jgi:CRP/FNR family transcriptional regulator, cyclic AMP receptor protein